MSAFEAGRLVVPSDPSWPEQFEAERSRLRLGLRPWLIEDVHHIGSTAIPGMPAKPIIDMMAGVRALSDAEAAEPVLADLGYQRRPHRIDAVHFARVATEADSHSLHLTVPGSALWQERLTFRDALRADPGLIEEYVALKARLLAEAGGQLYQAADKREFVRRVLAGAGLKLQDGMHSPR